MQNRGVDGDARSARPNTIESLRLAVPGRFYAATFLLPLPQAKFWAEIRRTSPRKRFLMA